MRCCKPHSFKTKVQWTAHDINNENKQHQHPQEVSLKSQRGVRVKHIQPSGNLWGRNDQNKVILIVRHGGGNRRKMIAVFEKNQKKSKTENSWGRWVTSILRPSTSVPWSFSLALSASALVSNVTKPKPCKPKKKGNRGGGKEDEWSLRFECIFIDTLDKFQVFCLSTLDPLSLKMISTSRILPNCWKWGKKRGGKAEQALQVKYYLWPHGGSTTEQ